MYKLVKMDGTVLCEWPLATEIAVEWPMVKLYRSNPVTKTLQLVGGASMDVDRYITYTEEAARVQKAQ